MNAAASPGTLPTCSARLTNEARIEAGWALGLAYSRWAVEANRGRIYVSTVPGKGCVFTVDLPRAAIPAVALA